MDIVRGILLASISIFVAVDAIGTLPIYIGLTEEFSFQKKKEIIKSSLLTAILVAIGFLFVGRIILTLLRITISDFMIAGGVLLFILAMNDILNPLERKVYSGSSVGAVPIGTPLIVGPAVLTTILLSIDVYGYPATLVGLLLNIALAGIIFTSSEKIIKYLGENGVKAISKVASLFLASIGVMLVRKGLQIILGG
jgi:multiple antibiotic resistance protein